MALVPQGLRPRLLPLAGRAAPAGAASVERAARAAALVLPGGGNPIGTHPAAPLPAASGAASMARGNAPPSMAPGRGALPTHLKPPSGKRDLAIHTSLPCRRGDCGFWLHGVPVPLGLADQDTEPTASQGATSRGSSTSSCSTCARPVPPTFWRLDHGAGVREPVLQPRPGRRAGPVPLSPPPAPALHRAWHPSSAPLMPPPPPPCRLSFPCTPGYPRVDHTREGEASGPLEHTLGYTVAEIQRLVDKVTELEARLARLEGCAR